MTYRRPASGPTRQSGDYCLGAEFRIHADLLDLLAGALWEAGTLGFQHSDADRAGRVRVRAFFPRGTVPATVMERLIPWLRAADSLDISSAGWKNLEAVDWNAVWRSSYAPIAVGERLVIVPSWHRRRMPGRSVVKIRPQMAFGTGSHETTRLCLETICASLSPGDRVADIGTGSGILALAAARLGAGRVDACDTDPLALTNARYNARLNRLDGRIAFYRGDVEALPRGRRYDLIVANLVFEPLQIGLPAMAARVARGGSLHLSGILAGQVGPLARLARSLGLKRQRRRCQNEWILLALTA